MTEQEPNTENVCYIDEYPHLEKRLQLRRAAGQLALFPADLHQLVLFPTDDTLSSLPEPPEAS